MENVLSVKLNLLIIWIQVKLAQGGLPVKLVMGIRHAAHVYNCMTNITMVQLVCYYQANQIVLLLNIVILLYNVKHVTHNGM